MIRYAALLLFIAVLAPHRAWCGELYELDTERDLILASSAAVGGALIWWGTPRVQPLSPAEVEALDAADLPAWDRAATRWWSPGAAGWSDVLGYGLTVAPLMLLAETGDEMSAGTFLAMYAEVVALDRVLVGNLKLGAGRVRPLAYNPDPRISPAERASRYSRRSFPSGHTSGAFAGAVFTGQVFARLNPDSGARHWVRGGSLGLAAATAVLRVRAGHHFPSDVLAGAVIGSLVGWMVPELHETDPDPVQPDLPVTGLRGPSLALAWRF